MKRISAWDISSLTIHTHIREMHRFWRWCANEYGLENPMKNIAYPGTPKQKTPKAADMRDNCCLFEVCGNDFQGRRDRALLAFLADTGACASGVCGLKMTNLDMKNRRAIVMEKGKKTQTVVFTGFTTSLLEEWLKGRPDVCIARLLQHPYT